MTTLPSIKSETSSSLPVGVPTIALDKMTPIIATPKTSLLKTEISKTASDTTAKVITTPAISKVPVTRILQQTLVLRAQQQQLQQQQQQLLQQQQKVPISANPQKVLLQAVPQATGQSLLNSSANATHVTLSAAPSSVNATPSKYKLFKKKSWYQFISLRMSRLHEISKYCLMWIVTTGAFLSPAWRGVMASPRKSSHPSYISETHGWVFFHIAHTHPRGCRYMPFERLWRLTYFFIYISWPK